MKKFQLTLKLGFALAIACAVLFTLPAGPSVQGKSGSKPTAASAASVDVILDIGRKARGCTGFGICKITVSASTSSKTAVKGTLSTTSDGKLSLALININTADEGKALILDEDVEVPIEAAAKLGFKKATLLRGEYACVAKKSVLSARLVK